MKRLRRRLDLLGEVMSDVVRQSNGVTYSDDLVMVFVPGDKGKGYRRITKVRVEDSTLPGESRRVILFADKQPGGDT